MVLLLGGCLKVVDRTLRENIVLKGGLPLPLCPPAAMFATHGGQRVNGRFDPPRRVELEASEASVGVPRWPKETLKRSPPSPCTLPHNNNRVASKALHMPSARAASRHMH